MGKIMIELETKYDKGDVVVFQRDGLLIVGIIEDYYPDFNTKSYIWYEIRVNKDIVFDQNYNTKFGGYINTGDVAEHDIVCKLNNDVTDFERILQSIIK